MLGNINVIATNYNGIKHKNFNYKFSGSNKTDLAALMTS